MKRSRPSVWVRAMTAALLTVLRAQLIQEMLDARRPDELKRVHALASSWLASHPDDVEVLFASEQVAMLMRAVQSTSTGGEQRAEEVAEAPTWRLSDVP